VKKLGRAIRRLVIAGALGAGALFAAVKVGPRVVSKVGPILRRAPASEAVSGPGDDPAEPAATGASDLPADHSDGGPSDIVVDSEQGAAAEPSE
jgi:hypothetical protein